MDCHTGLIAPAEISFFGTGSMEFYLDAFRNSGDSHKHTIEGALNIGQWVKSWRLWDLPA
jgi:hypothetical protein